MDNTVAQHSNHMRSSTTTNTTVVGSTTRESREYNVFMGTHAIIITTMNDPRNAAVAASTRNKVTSEPQQQQQERAKGGSVMMNYFLAILAVFGSVQFYFNFHQDNDVDHQRDSIEAFQRTHFIKSHSLGRVKGDMKTFLMKNLKEHTTRSDHHVHLAAVGIKGGQGQQQQQQQEKEEQDEEREFDYREQDIDKHYLAGLNCERFGGPSDEDAAEMVFWEDIPSDSLHISPFQDPKRKQYLTFEADHGAYGWELCFGYY